MYNVINMRRKVIALLVLSVSVLAGGVYFVNLKASANGGTGGGGGGGGSYYVGCKSGWTCLREDWSAGIKYRYMYMWRYYKLHDIAPGIFECAKTKYAKDWNNIFVCGNGSNEWGPHHGYVSNCKAAGAPGYWRLGIRSRSGRFYSPDQYPEYSLWGAPSLSHARLKVREGRGLFSGTAVVDGREVSADVVRRAFESNAEAFYNNHGWTWSAGNFFSFCSGDPNLEPRQFKTDADSKIKGEVVHSGEKVSGEVKLKLKSTDGKSNKEGLPDLKGKMQAIEFTLPAGAGTEVIKGKEEAENDAGMQSGGVCSFFGRKGAQNCNLVKESPGPYNKSGLWYHNQSEPDANATLAMKLDNRTVPDNLPIGSKYCIAMGAYPSKANLKVKNNHLEAEQPFTWNVSNASCRTIAKKPSFQVWNGSVMTNGKIQTSQSSKNEGRGMGAFDHGAAKNFGSWTEQAVIANGDVRGFSSAAGLGFGGYEFNLAGGNKSVKMGELSDLTVSNTDVANLGKAKVKGANSIKGRLKTRFSNPSKLSKEKHLTYHNLGSGGTIGRTVVGTNDPKNTIVYSSTGTVTITGDICYSNDGGCGSDNLAQQSLNSNNISILPQVLIFARDIKIAENVKRIDAWLVANDEIDTCSAPDLAKRGSAACSGTLTVNGPVFARHLSLNRTAGAWSSAENGWEGWGVLGRNYAAKGTVSPAEIFNLRADSFLWSNRQANLSSQGSTTYVRELAPRL